MPYQKIEDCPGNTVTPIEVNQSGRNYLDGSTYSYKTTSSGNLVGHTIWRCYSCKAMAVTTLGAGNPGKCAKCGR